jgi:hypothetical protein
MRLEGARLVLLEGPGTDVVLVLRGQRMRGRVLKGARSAAVVRQRGRR